MSEALRGLLDRLVESAPFEKLLLERARPIKAHAQAGEDALIAALAVALDAPVLAVAPEPRAAEHLAQSIAAWLGPERVAEFPAWEALPAEGIAPTAEISARRAEAARRARDAGEHESPFVVVTPAHALVQQVAPTFGAHEPLELVAGGEISPDDLIDRLVEELGYERADVVEHRGEFAVRGGIIDLFPGTARRPVRLEYLGDEIESIRTFVPATQRSADTLPGGTLVAVEPVREPPAERKAITLPELLPRGTWAVLTSARRTIDRAAQAFEESEAIAEATSREGPAALLPLDDVLDRTTRLELSEFTEGVDLGLHHWGSAEGNAVELAQRIGELRGPDLVYHVVAVAESHGGLARITEVLAEQETTAAEKAMATGLPIVEAQLTEGFVFEQGRIAVATEEDLFGSRKHTREAPRMVRRRAGTLVEDLEPGDYIVHRIHGVGRFEGIVHRDIGDAERDYLVLEYAKGDKLYVPSDQVGMVEKYGGGEAPRVHRLGSSDWTRTKNKVRKAVKDMAGELVRLYSVRMAIEGHRSGPDSPWQRELEDAFPFEETGDQLVAIEEVKADMELGKPMDRLICGDVGYGKTEVAVRAAFKSVMDGKQVAILVPTTLLAEQHYVTFTERYAPFPVKVAMLSRFLSDKEQDEVVKGVADGSIDVVIGTHRLLSKDVTFKDLGLVVIDEEQRFGVAHKERLKQLRAHVDVLSMTATPIPRTMEMALTGIRVSPR